MSDCRGLGIIDMLLNPNTDFEDPVHTAPPLRFPRLFLLRPPALRALRAMRGAPLPFSAAHSMTAGGT